MKMGSMLKSDDAILHLWTDNAILHLWTDVADVMN